MDYIFSFLFLALLIPFAIGGLSMAPWVPTRKKDVERALDLISLKDGENFFEIGCGDARISLAIARKYPKCSIYGTEIAFPVFVIAYTKKYIGRVQNASIRLGNAFKEDFGKYDHLYVFGMPDKMQSKIVPKFLREAKSGAKLYSYVFSIPEEYKEHVKSYGGENEAKIHVLEKK